MRTYPRLTFCLKWFSILWTVCAGAIFLLSHIMITLKWSPIENVTPFDVRDNLKFALLIAPGPAAALISLFLERWTRIRALQLLVSVSVLLYFLWISLPHIPHTHSNEAQQILAMGGYGAQSWIADPRFYLSVGALKVLASIGLFLGVLTLFLISMPFAGISVGTPLENVVGFVATLIDGAVLALAFSSPIADAMRRDQ